MSRRAQQRGGGLMDKLPVGRAAAAGAIAYVVGYVVTFVFVEIESDESILDTDEYLFEAVGWFFYNAHFVDTEQSQNGQSQTSNLISEATDLTIPEPIWYLVPIALLIGAGYFVANGTDSPGADPTDAAMAGAAVVAGYLPLAALGTFLFEVSQSQQVLGQSFSISISPDTVPAIALAGIGFPLVLGAVGGFAAAQTDDSSARGAAGRGSPSNSRQDAGRGGQQRGRQQQARQQQGGQRQGRQQQGGQQRGGQQQGGQQRGGQQQGGQQGGQDDRGNRR